MKRNERENKPSPTHVHPAVKPGKSRKFTTSSCLKNEFSIKVEFIIAGSSSNNWRGSQMAVHRLQLKHWASVALAIANFGLEDTCSCRFHPGIRRSGSLGVW